jgi:predicted nucleic acid-binding protein
VRFKYIVVDTNIIIRSIFGVKVLALIEKVQHQACFLTPDICLEEAQKYIPSIASKRNFDLALIEEGLVHLKSIMEIVPASLYEQYKSEAIQRIKQRDVNDWPILATALLFDCPIWTEDQDFFGTGVPTWTSDKIHLYFSVEEK